MCAFCGYDEKKELRCGFASHPNKIIDLKKCPLINVRKRRR